MQALKRAFSIMLDGDDGYLVPGGSYVYVPSARTHEIPRVLAEHRDWERRNRAYFRKGSGL